MYGPPTSGAIAKLVAHGQLSSEPVENAFWPVMSYVRADGHTISTAVENGHQEVRIDTDTYGVHGQADYYGFPLQFDMLGITAEGCSWLDRDVSGVQAVISDHPQSDALPANVFRRRGSFWEVRFNFCGVIVPICGNSSTPIVPKQCLLPQHFRDQSNGQKLTGPRSTGGKSSFSGRLRAMVSFTETSCAQ